MKKRLIPAVIGSLMFFAPVGVFAADDPAPTDKPAADKPAAPTSPAAPATPGARGNRQGGFGGFGGIGARDPLASLMTALGDVNLETDFTLTPEQKEKIQIIVTDFKKSTDKWKTDHEAELKKIQDDFAALRNNAGGRQTGGNNAAGGGNNNRQQFQQVTQARQALMDTAPKPDEAIAQIKGLLTTEQLKKLQTKIDEIQAEAAKARQNLQGAFGGRGGNANGGGGANGGGNAAGGRGGRGGGGGGGGGRGGRGGGAGGAGGAANGA